MYMNVHASVIAELNGYSCVLKQCLPLQQQLLQLSAGLAASMASAVVCAVRGKQDQKTMQ
jgi:hypothetical protein